jgi:hypothetical protein
MIFRSQSLHSKKLITINLIELSSGLKFEKGHCKNPNSELLNTDKDLLVQNIFDWLDINPVH